MNAKYNKLDGYRDTGGECCCAGQIRRNVHRTKHSRRGEALTYDKMDVGPAQEKGLICRLPVETFVAVVN
jgi:hypothetical protein